MRAKRYLVATDAEYRAKLSASSERSLVAQGGALDAAGAAAFERMPWASDAIALRRWDDAAKLPAGPAIGVDELLAIYVRFRARR